MMIPPRVVLNPLALSVLLAALLLAACQGPPAVPPVEDPFAAAAVRTPAVGDTYVYQLSDGYRNRAPEQITYRVESVNADHVVVAVAGQTNREGGSRTEIYTRDGNWLRHAFMNHDQIALYDFNPPYPVVPHPLAAGKSWSTRLIAMGPAGIRQNVRVDGKVVRGERIRVPAGEFDTIQIRRHVYAGDADYRTQSLITETDWYAPGLGMPVRVSRQAEWDEMRSCDGPFCDRTRRSDWQFYELVSYPASAR